MNRRRRICFTLCPPLEEILAEPMLVVYVQQYPSAFSFFLLTSIIGGVLHIFLGEKIVT